MSYTFAELRKMSVDELIRQHDRHAPQTGIGISYYLEEISRRESERVERSIRNMTAWIVVLTILNTAFVAMAALKELAK